MKKFLGICAIMLTVVAVIATMWSAKSAAAAETEEVRIGVISSLSGPAVAWGLPTYQTWKLQKNMYNQAGGVKIGDKVYRIKFLVEDDKYMPEPGVAAVKKLIYRDKVDYILGGISTLITVAAGPIYQKNKVIAMVDGTSGPGIGPKLTWVFRMIVTEFERAVAIAGWLSKNKPEIRKVAYVAPDTEGGHGSIKIFKKVTGRVTDWKIGSGEFYEPGSKDYYAVLSKVLKEKPDLLYTDTASPGDFGLIMKQSRELGFKGKIWYGAITDPAVPLAIAGAKACEDWYSPNYPFNVTTEMKKLTAAYHKEYGEYSTTTTCICDTLPVLIQAMQQAGTIDKYKVRDALETGKFTSVCGSDARFYGKDRYGIAHQWIRPICISRMHNGKQELVDQVSPKELLKMLAKLGIKE